MVGLLRIIPALAAFAVAGTAQAQLTPEVASDVECVIVSGFVDGGEQTDTASQQASTMYFVGKLAARGVDYATLIVTAASLMTDAEVAAAGERCGNELIALGRNLDGIGAAMQAQPGN